MHARQALYQLSYSFTPLPPKLLTFLFNSVWVAVSEIQLSRTDAAHIVLSGRAQTLNPEERGTDVNSRPSVEQLVVRAW